MPRFTEARVIHAGTRWAMELRSVLAELTMPSITLHVSCCCEGQRSGGGRTIGITRTRSSKARMPKLHFSGRRALPKTLWRFTHIQGGTELLVRLVRHSLGVLDDEAKELVPDHERHRVIRESRVMVVVLVAAVAMSALTTSLLPVVLGWRINLSRGAGLVVFFGITQHAGLQENVLDHRLNTRTVAMNPVFRFLYLNMNFHVEHHMFPSVPYYSLARTS